MSKLVSADEIRLFILVALGLAVVVGGITALSVVLTKPPEDKTILPKISPFKAGTDTLGQGPLLLSDFVLPREGGTWLSRPWYFSREPLQKWPEREVEKFWVDSLEFQLEKIPEATDSVMERLLED